MIKNVFATGTASAGTAACGTVDRLKVSLASLTPLHWIWVLLLFACYTVLRVMVWQRSVLFEDTDSVALVWWAQAFLTLDPEAIMRLDADASLFYPFLSALCSLPGWSADTGARLASLLSSLALFWFIFLIGLQIARPVPVLLGLVLLTFNPEMVRLSPTILTEPSYVAIVYAGLLVLWWQLPRLAYSGAVVAGFLFACAFLNRMEGILFVGFGPLAAGLYFLWKRPPGWGWSRLISWSLLYVACFSLIAGLQIWRVSHVMGTLAINGRQVGSVLSHAPVGDDTPEAKILGLDFSPDQINVRYLKQNARELFDLPRPDDPSASLVRNFTIALIRNLYDLHDRRLVQLFGLPVVVLAVLGLLQLYQTGRRFESVLVLLVVVWGLAAPLVHNVVIRHIAVMAPLLLLIAGLGADFLARLLLAGGSARMRSWVISLGTVVLALLAWGFPLRAVLNPPHQDNYHSPVELAEPVRIVRQIAADKPERSVAPLRRGRADPPGSPTQNPGRQAAVVSRTPFLPYFAQARFLPLPWTDYPGLVNYCRLNEADALYLQELNQALPFWNDFASDAWQADFLLLYQGEDAYGRPVRLYRFKATATDEASRPSDSAD